MSPSTKTLLASPTLLLLVMLAFYGCGPSVPVITEPYPAKESFFTEDFEGASVLSTRLWQMTRENDFRDSIIDLYSPESTERRGNVLRLGADTMGTDDKTVKFHGLVLKNIIDFSRPVEISYELDWNNQTNGSYMSAGVYLCPEFTGGNPQSSPDWLRFQYIGVPPGKNARGLLQVNTPGRSRPLYDEGWPREKSGRAIARQQVHITIGPEGVRLIENGKQLYNGPHNLDFDRAYLYLQMSSHSNCRMRQVYFDNIRIGPAR